MNQKHSKTAKRKNQQTKKSQLCKSFVARGKTKLLLKKKQQQLNNRASIGSYCTSILTYKYIRVSNNMCMLKNATGLSGFKKCMFNRIKVHNYRLLPVYNRRKHNASHYMQLTNTQSKLSKTFGYMNKNFMDFLVAITLKAIYSFAVSTYTKSFTDSNNNTNNPINGSFPCTRRAVPYLVCIIETSGMPLLRRNLLCGSFRASHALLRHNKLINNSLYFARLYGLNKATHKMGQFGYVPKSAEYHVKKKWLYFGEVMRGLA